MSFNNRLKTIRTALINQKIGAALISDVTNIIYLTGFDNFSKTEREAFLLITPSDQYLFTDARYTEEVAKRVPDFTLIEISAKHKLKAVLAKLIKQHQIISVGVEEDNLTLAEYKRFSTSLKKTKPFSLSKLRMIKDTDEIQRIKQACQLGDQLFEHTLAKIKPGLSEKQLAWEMEKFTKDNGAQPSFDTIVAFNANAAIPHHQTGDTRLPKEAGQLILLDFGIKLNNYCSDMTRVVFWGKATQEQRKIYQTVLDSQQKAVQYLQTHHSRSAIQADKAARDYIKAASFPDIPHSLGHGIGLEVHESPRLSPNSKDQLKNGMVFSIEPGIYLPGDTGVRLEDLFSIENKKLVQLTKSSKKIIELS